MNADLEPIEIDLGDIKDLEPYNPDGPAFTVSQSMIKSFSQYKRQSLCGLLFVEMHINGNTLDLLDSQAIRLGHYFEHKVTGAVPRNGVVPEVELYKVSGGKEGAKYKVGDPKPQFLHAERQAQNCLAYMKAMKLTVIASNIRVDNGLGRGVLDIVAQVAPEAWEDVVNDCRIPGSGTEPYGIYPSMRREDCVFIHPETGEAFEGCIVLDLKYSGLLHDRWNELGWDLDSLPDKVSHTTQAKHYAWITGLPFFFFVFSSKTEDAKIIRINIDPSVLDPESPSCWGIRVMAVREMILAGIRSNMFYPWPSIKACSDCPLRETCQHRATIPPISVVPVTPDTL
jgi:hypothetical protein